MVSQSVPVANSIDDAARRLGIGRTTLYELIKGRELTSFKVGKRTLIPESELQQFVARRIAAT